MSKWQITRETRPGSGAFDPVETFEGSQMDVVLRCIALRTDGDGAYMATPSVEPPAPPAEPAQAPSA
jgi:hypothetical protein